MLASPFLHLHLLALYLVLASLCVAPTPLQRRDNFIPTGPKFVLYSLSDVGANVLPPLNRIQGFNVINLAFLQSGGPQDQVQNWANLPATRRQQLRAQYNAAGVSLVVAAFGASDLPTTNGRDPTATANTMAQFVLNHNLDGIDVDYEELQLVLDQPGTGEMWVSVFTQALRGQLPQGQFILSHAPIAPWFQPNFCPGGCYLTVDKDVGSLIDWYNIQFYNQSPNPGYENCNTLLHSAGGSSVFEIRNSGVNVNKIIIGKPGNVQDTTDGGYMAPGVLGTCVSQAVRQGWHAGVMAWQFPHADAAWIAAVKKHSFG